VGNTGKIKKSCTIENLKHLFQLDGFAEKGYKRKCSLNSEIQNTLKNSIIDSSSIKNITNPKM
jgi:hypothetical protein